MALKGAGTASVAGRTPEAAGRASAWIGGLGEGRRKRARKRTLAKALRMVSESLCITSFFNVESHITITKEKGGRRGSMESLWGSWERLGKSWMDLRWSWVGLRKSWVGIRWS